MKGIIFNIVEEVVTAAHGEGVWDEMLDRAGLNGVYTSLGTYGDGELALLIDEAAWMFEMPPDGVLRWVGGQAIPRMAARWPEFFAGHTRTASFLRSLNGVIHPEVHKLYAGAVCPHFGCGIRPDGMLSMAYRSPRRLCGLAHGFIMGAGVYFADEVHVIHVECMHAGDRQCLMVVRGA